MKKLIVAFAVCVCAGALMSAEAPKMTLEEAKEKISVIVSNPEKMGEVMKQLSAEDQKAFLAEVNKAISALPGSNESKTAKSLDINREALLNAKKGNLQPLVATMFATVSLESLTVLAERYGEDLFNRAADATKTFTDEQFTEIASSTVAEVQKSCDGLPDSGPRDILAIYLFERASNQTIPTLEDTLLGIIKDASVRELAKKEWLPAANGTGSDRFSSLLAYAEAGRSPNVDVTLKIAGPQLMNALLADLANGVTDAQGHQILPITKGESWEGAGPESNGGTAAQADQGLTINPKSSSPVAPWNPSYSDSAAEKAKEEIVTPEPKPYPYQD